MRIGLLSYRSNPFSGGQGIYVRHLSSALNKLGHEVEVLSGPPYPLLDNNIKLVRIPSLDLFSTNERLKAFNISFLTSLTDFIEWAGVLSGAFPEPYTFGRRVSQYLQDKKSYYDIIHDNQSLSYSLVKLQKEFPLVTTIHHPITKDHRIEVENSKNWIEKLSSNRWHSFLKMQKRVAPQLENIICPSSQSKSDVIREFKVQEKRVEAILNGIDLDTFRYKQGIKKVPFRIITSASADIPLKGLRFLIEALPKVLLDFPETCLSVIGKAKEKGEITKLITKLDLKGKISFHSELSEIEIVNLYSSAQIAVIPSLYEGFGFGAGEALACSLPLISTHSGGLKEVVGEAAVQIKSGDAKEISTAIIDLFSNPEKQAYYSRLGRERMESEFDWLKAAEEYVKIYEEVINRFSMRSNVYNKI